MNRIIIGVGGHGSGLVNEISRRIKEGATPEEMMDKEFIVFDSNSEDQEKLKHLKEKYKILLATHDREVMRNCAPFLKEDYSRASGAGAGIQRIYGRGLYLCNKDRITGAIEAAARELNERTKDYNFLIIIINTFGGGTGSSMPMDIAMDARAVISSNYDEDPRIFGIGILCAKDEASDYSANTYGAMKELHFILSTTEYNEIGGKNYSNPYLMYLLLGLQGEGVTHENEIREALSHVLIDLGFIPVERYRPEKKWLDMADLEARARPSMNKFSTIGYYEARFPVDELLLYYDLKDKIPEYERKTEEISVNLKDMLSEIKDKKEELTTLKGDLESLEKSIKDMVEDSWLGRKSRNLKMAEEHAETIKKTINATNDEIEILLEERNNLERELGEAKAFVAELKTDKNEIFRKLKSPRNTKILHNVPLTEDNIESLGGIRGNLSRMCFREIMSELGKEAEYNRITAAMLQRILGNSLLNYRLATEEYDHEVYEILSVAGFGFLSKVGETIKNMDDMLGNILVVISTDEGNIEEAQLGETDFINRMKGRVARNVDVKRVEPKTGPHSFAIYSFLLGIHPWALSTGRTPRLKELEWTGDAYEKTPDTELEIRHSFMYGESEVFKKLTGIEIILKDTDSRREAVTKFWKQYEIIDETVLWNRMPITIAESIIRIKGIGKEFERVNTRMSSVALPVAYKDPNAFSPAQLKSLTEKLGEFESDIRNFEGNIKSFGDGFSSLKNEINLMKTFVEGASATTNEKSMVNLIGQYNRYLHGVRNQLQLILDSYETNSVAYLNDAEDFVSKIPAEKQTTQFIIDNIVKAQSEIGHLKESGTKVRSDLQNLDVTIVDLTEALDSTVKVIESKVKE